MEAIANMRDITITEIESGYHYQKFANGSANA
jgi:hypothetical protein